MACIFLNSILCKELDDFSLLEHSTSACPWVVALKCRPSMSMHYFWDGILGVHSGRRKQRYLRGDYKNKFIQLEGQQEIVPRTWWTHVVLLIGCIQLLCLVYIVLASLSLFITYLFECWMVMKIAIVYYGIMRLDWSYLVQCTTVIIQYQIQQLYNLAERSKVM